MSKHQIGPRDAVSSRAEVSPQSLPTTALARERGDRLFTLKRPPSKNFPFGDALAAHAWAMQNGALAESTKKNYEMVFRRFAAWCEERDIIPSHAQSGDIVDYMAHLEDDRKMTLESIRNHLKAIRRHCISASGRNPFDAPAVRLAVSALRQRARSKKRVRVTPECIRTVAIHIDESTLVGKRDKAMLLVKYFSALPPRFFSLLEWENTTFYGDDGVRLNYYASHRERFVVLVKTEDPEVDPIRALKAWKAALGRASGAMFPRMDLYGNVYYKNLTHDSVKLIVRTLAAKAGVDPTDITSVTMRAGMVARLGRQARTRSELAIIAGYASPHGPETLLKR